MRMVCFRCILQVANQPTNQTLHTEKLYQLYLHAKVTAMRSSHTWCLFAVSCLWKPLLFLAAEDLTLTSCLLSGVYTKTQHGYETCEYSLAIGCYQRPPLMHLNGTCTNRTLTAHAYCIRSWRVADTSYLLAQYGQDIACIVSIPSRDSSLLLIAGRAPSVILCLQ